jgi:hypothetical protein
MTENWNKNPIVIKDDATTRLAGWCLGGWQENAIKSERAGYLAKGLATIQGEFSG